MKALKLGQAEVSFEHIYETRTVVCKKTKKEVNLSTPVGTKAIIKIGDSVTEGQSFVSKNDTFKFETGRKLSMARALKQIVLPKAVKLEIWTDYRNLKPGGRW